MKRILILKGTNCDEFFVQANELIYSIENETLLDNLYFENIQIINLGFDRTHSILNQIKTLCKFFNDGTEIKNESINEELKKYIRDGDVFYYYLYVTNKDKQSAFDVIPLRYFSIMRRKWSGKIFLGIEEDKLDNRQRISSYMFLDNLSEMNCWNSRWELIDQINKYSLHIKRESLDENAFYNQLFTISSTANRCILHHFGSFNKIIPCIFLDWEWFHLFSDDINMHIKNIDVASQIYKDNVPVLNDYIFKIQTGLCQMYNQDCLYENEYKNNLDISEWKHFFYELMICDICIDNLKNGHIIERGENNEVLKLCNGMSMLALLLFSSFCHFIYDSMEKCSEEIKKEVLGEVEINNLKQSAQDFAEGLLQLMENALEYSEGCCFSFRIHAGDSPHFEHNYQQFVINQKIFYLEVLITDINYTDSIPKKFLKNLKKRVAAGELPGKLVDEIANHITLQGFFSPNKEMQSIWDEYYKIAENVTNHYGLQLFNTLVNYYQGFFSVTSKDYNSSLLELYSVNYGKEKKSSNSVKECIPGTQYAILLPIKRQEEQKRVGIHVSPDFGDIAMQQEWKSKIKGVNAILMGSDGTSVRRDKSLMKENIRSISEKLDSYYQKKQIYVIDLNELVLGINAELISKAMITFILHHQKDDLRIALINASHDFVLQFTRYFAIFYNKSGRCTAMRKVQLFLCDKEYRTEISFSGYKLITTYASNELWANAKGEYNECLEMLQIIIKQRTTKATKNGSINKFAPFDLLIKDNGLTLFERRVQNDLKNNIQDEPFGCLLENIHMRVGSKMHVTNHFYETFQLFNSSLYNSRFAYLIASKIYKRIKSKNKQESPKDLVLVGYDVYSELLILETRKILFDLYKISSRGIIYEQMPHPNFRMWVDDMKNSTFVIIVPTSTTLTTHGKIIVELARSAGIENIEDFAPAILLNIALILIRDSSKKSEDGIMPNGTIIENNLSVIEKNYWRAIQNNEYERLVWTKTTHPEKIDFFVLVESCWQEPLSCQSCYPKDSILNEKPIIEVNRTSVIPMIMAGPVRSSLEEKTYKELPETDISILQNVMYYGHGKRSNNHFQYYFKTDQLMQDIVQNNNKMKKFKEWLDTIKEDIQGQKGTQEEKIREMFKQTPFIYDILVAPIHETNATFLEMINRVIFENAPLILYIDSDREYRENILSKYSNLTALYNNILHTGRRAIINFNYVDDSINSGITFRRTHDLLRSLFPEEAYLDQAKVQVNLFQNVFILINRSSRSSIKEYIHKGNYYSYVNLRVSGLRNHHDNACAVCSELNDYDKLKKCSATNNMAFYWQNKIINKKLIPVEDMKRSVRQNQYFRRMLCTHEINRSLQEMGWERNISDKVYEKIEILLLKRLQDKELDSNLKMEYMMAYFTVLSKPYLSYRKSVLDATFPMFLAIVENLINNDLTLESRHTVQITKLIHNEFFENQSLQIKEDFLKVMINAIAKLGACYIIRLEVLNKVFILADDIEVNLPKFELFYGAAVKRLITLGKDESNCLWLEYLILNGYEYNGNVQLTLNVSQRFRDLLFYENTYIISGAIDELIYKKVKSIEDVEKYISMYYFENFRKLMNIDYQGKLTESLSEPGTDWTEIKKILVEMVNLKNHLTSRSEKEDYYTELLDYIQKIANTEYASIYGIDELERIYIIACTEEGYYSTKDLQNIEHMRKKSQESEDYINSTVFFCDENMVLLCLTGKEIEENIDSNEDKNINTMDAVWLMLKFKREKKEKTTLARRQHGAAIRYVLIYRHLLWERLRDDFHKNTFSKIKELSIKNKLLSTWKVGSHTPDTMLIRIEEKLKNVKVDNNDNMAWAGSLLQLAADSLISKLYVEQVLDEPVGAKKEQDYEIERPLSFESFVFTQEKKELLNQLVYNNKDRSRKELTHANVIVDHSAEIFDFMFPAEMRYYNMYILASIVQNAVKHGMADEGNVVNVFFKVKGKYLIIENILKKGYQCEICDDGKGITEIALKHYFIKYYRDEMLTNPNAKSSTYCVQIPVIRLNDE